MRFDINSYKKQLWLSISTGVFLFVVLYLYRSFGIQTNESLSGHGLLFRASSFGFLTSITFFLNEFIIAPTVTHNNIKKQIAWRLWEIFSAATASFLLFNYFWNWTEFNFTAYFLMIFEFFIVMIIPVGLVNLIMKNNYSTDYKIIALKAENGKTQLSLNPDKLYFIKSDDNYVIVYFESNGSLKKKLIRNSLKNVENEFKDILIRSQRSYLVNPLTFQYIETSGKKTTLVYPHHLTVPVSPRYQEEFANLNN
ncbi:LytTR family DNA-binding domain-containing protein [Mangrovivirga sp. M17]|uniref:LytTR family DNA-binding domain-containing protein n=1 Tax=Mangrovivirga halotolerans TaxID=2993936 RepID=A0ABT3RPA7_9BACT|nr:LytTR family DNA-binding domain-containing protein [Mangrovivirga halotolerans]MCX2743005.1 LytTR family DNA-binding domain-containing protein [Mangrovivirga halotolerans]